MKAKINYKSKKTIIIAIIVLALITLSALAVGLFLKGNNEAEAAGNNTIGNTVDNNANQPSNNVAGDAGNEATDGENANTGNNDNENIDNEDAENANTDNENANEGNANNANQENANNQNDNQENIPNQEFVTERVETIPERVIAENYWVSWGPTQFETLINGTISLEKAKIVAEKTVAKVTASGLEQNPQSVKVGEILKYTITLTNTSKKVNGLVNVTDEIPAGTEFVSATKTNLTTTPAQYENSSEVTSLAWKNVKVEAGSEVTLVVYVKVIAKVEGEDTTAVQNIATIYDGTTPEEDVPSPETKVANITSSKTSKIIYNERKPHEHIVVGGREPLHEQDIIEYTITLTNVGQAAGTVKVSDTVPEGTTFINGEFVTVVDKNGKTTYQIEELVEGINVTVPEANDEAGIATVTFRVIVNSFEEETKIIRNDMAKVDGTSTNTTEDEAEKVYIDIPVTKVWKNMESDAAKHYAITIITIQVKLGDTVVQEKAVTADDNWTVEFTGLKKYDENGNLLVYTIDEVVAKEDEEKLSAYDKEIVGNTITNTFNPDKVQDETTELTATKVWENMESDAAQAYAITSITIQVKLGNTVVQEKAVTEKENWTAEFVGLKKYDENGNLLVYTIDEVVAKEDEEKLSAYDKEIVGNTITNTFNPNKVTDTVNIPASKVWVNIENDAAKTYALKSIKLQLFANDVLKAEQIVAEKVDIENGIAGEWKYTFTNLTKYDAEGNIIEYTVGEAAVNEADKAILEKYITSIDEETGIITNTFNPDKVQDDTTELTATKVWENMESDAAQAYAITSITIQVKLGNTVVQEKAVTEKENWTAEFVGLKKYDENGNLLVYTIDEVVAKEDEEKLSAYDKEIVGNTIKNTFNPDKVQDDTTELTATKVWENMESDAAQHYAITSITIQVKLGNTVVESKAVTAKENWTAKFTGLKKYNEDGNELVYTVDEVVAKADEEKLAAYDKEIVGNTITNTFNPDKVQDDTIELTVTKVWDDNNDEYQVRPESITITLGGKEYSLDAEKDENKETLNEWTLTINDLPKYDANGNEIEYELHEEKVTYYENPVYSQDGLTVTNTINLDGVITEQPGTVTINVTSTTTATVSTPMDVVFVIDTSGSMQGSNATNMVNAVNNSIKTIMSKNSENRIGIVGFSGNKEQTITNSSTIIPLGKYATNTNYLRLYDNTIYSTVTSNSRAITGGTNTQAGIKAGAEMLTSQATTTFTTTVNGINVTGTRTPVLIIVTDGEPTYYYADEAATGTRIGNGQTSNTDENYYYWTIRTAKYYKNAVTTKYYAGTTKQAKMFTIGIGIGTDNLTEDDYLAKAMLNPNKANVDACNDGTSIETETDRWGNVHEKDNRSEKKKLYDLLNSAGTPYAYDYANASKSGELTESDIESFLTSSLEGSSESMTVRAITTEETTNRRIDLTNIDTSKAFTLELIGEETVTYTFAEAQSAGYVKLDSSTSTYYVDLSDVEKTVTVNVNYWEIEQQAN